MSASARPSSSDNGGDASEGNRSPRGVCPGCNRSFKDLKVHAFTHARERPEKCPIKACEYQVRGFSRKHDRNRHALNHYRGTLICGFCPGLGSPAEISFNRVDLFKKQVVEIHGVPMKPPNGPRPPGTRSGVEAAGDCNICRQTFLSPDDLYDHLDDCVLSVLNEEDPAGAINGKLLAEVATSSPELYHREPPPITGRENNLHMDARRSSNSVSPCDTRNRRNRGHYPAAWGFDDSQLSLKKRVAAVFDGPIRLARDEVLLSRDLEIRLKLSDGVSYVTDLDVMTLNRAEATFAWPEEAALSATQQVPQTSYMGD